VTNRGARYETLRVAASACSIRETLCRPALAPVAPAARVGIASVERPLPASGRRPPSKLRLFHVQPGRGAARIAGMSPRSWMRAAGGREGLATSAKTAVSRALDASARTPEAHRGASAVASLVRALHGRSGRLETSRSDGTVALVKALENPIFETFSAGAQPGSGAAAWKPPGPRLEAPLRAPRSEGFRGVARRASRTFRTENVSSRARRTGGAGLGEDRMRVVRERRMLDAEGSEVPSGCFRKRRQRIGEGAARRLHNLPVKAFHRGFGPRARRGSNE